MPSNKKPRKRYVPRAKLLDPLGFVVEGVRQVADHDSYLVDLKLVNHSALETLLKGQAKKAHINKLLAAYNILESFRELIATKKLPLPIELDASTLIRGKCALLELASRGALTDHFVCREPEIQALHDLMQLHDELMNIITVGQMTKAIEYVTSKIARKHATVINDYLEETV